VVLQYARNLALIAFATAAINGIITHCDFEGSLRTALAAGAVFYPMGLAFGELGRRIVEESAEAEVRRSLEANQQAHL
jgi:hypothetical protein